MTRIDHINLKVANNFVADSSSVNIANASSIDDDAAAVLANFEGELQLDGLIEISEKSAKSLSKHKGWSLTLNGIRQLSVSAAESLACYHGGILKMNGMVSQIYACAEISKEIAFLVFKASSLAIDPALLTRKKIID